MQKFVEWKKIVSNCPALVKTRPFNMCLYEGKPCCFVSCPRRVFEKELKEEGFVPIEDQIKKVWIAIRELKDSFNVLNGQVEHLPDLILAKVREKQTTE